MRRLLKFVLVGLAVVMLATAAGLYGWLLTALPRVSGSVSLGAEAGLTAPVDILRDARGVPHIHGQSAHDLYVALGFVHAQDRFWQMEAMRRLGAGRLAEVLGSKALPTDRLMRTLDLRGLAERQYDRLLPETRAVLEAYAAGVNAWLKTYLGALPPELELLRIKPEPWQPADSLVWGKLMAFKLSGNWQDELLRLRLAARLTPPQLDQLWPDRRGRPRKTGARDPGLGALAAKMADALGAWAEAPRGASNAWAVDGPHSATAGPLLANDPHLGFSAPILWYLARLESPDFAVTGATVPGVPFVILGHNRRVAWGMTTTQADAADLFIEYPVPDDPGSYRTPAGPRPFETRTETIRVRGGADETLVVRRTRHGPVISDVLGTEAAALAGDGAVLALSATYLRDGDLTPQAIDAFNRAQGWGDFRAALADFHTPLQNVLYGDVEGHIAFQVAGKVPRRRGGTGWVAADGESGAGDWTGFVPFTELPAAIDPANGRLVSANHRIVPDDYPDFISDDWAPGYRARRIHALLDENPAQSLETMARIQRDHLSLMALDLLPILRETKPANHRDARALEILAHWDGLMSNRRPEPLMFLSWLKELNREIAGDELGDLYDALPGVRARFLRAVLRGGPAAAWCDDVATETRETCDEILTRSLLVSVDSMVETHGANFVRWHWGQAHKAQFLHPLARALPSFARLFWGRETVADGGDYTVNRGAMDTSDPDHPFADIHGPGFRAIYDLEKLSRSRFMIATGQSGIPFSGHYDDMLIDWRNGSYMRLALTRRDLEETGLGTLTLTP